MLRLFLRRLIDNDVISPHADRHESLAVLCALVVSLAVFVTFFITTEYLAAFIQLPGPTALSALSDRFLFISASIAVSALAALMVWDALALEPRDAAILGTVADSGAHDHSRETRRRLHLRHRLRARAECGPQRALSRCF